MTAARLAGLTLGELRSTRETRDLDTPARAATVSRVGRRPAALADSADPPGPVPGVATSAPCRILGMLGMLGKVAWSPLERSKLTSALPRRGLSVIGPAGAQRDRASGLSRGRRGTAGDGGAAVRDLDSVAG